jgi:serine/threonine protein kinase
MIDEIEWRCKMLLRRRKVILLLWVEVEIIIGSSSLVIVEPSGDTMLNFGDGAKWTVFNVKLISMSGKTFGWSIERRSNAPLYGVQFAPTSSPSSSSASSSSALPSSSSSFEEYIFSCACEEDKLQAMERVLVKISSIEKRASELSLMLGAMTQCSSPAIHSEQENEQEKEEHVCHSDSLSTSSDDEVEERKDSACSTCNDFAKFSFNQLARLKFEWEVMRSASAPERLRAIDDDKLVFKRDVDSLLGKGAAARVYAGRYGDREVAVKVLVDLSQLDEFRRECAMLSRIMSPHIVSALGARLDDVDSPLCLLPRCKGSVRQMLDERAGKPPRLSTAVRWAMQAAKALLYLHDKCGVLHRDFKTCNVLVDVSTSRRGRLLLCDLGHARSFTELTMTGTGIGTCYALAPELLNGERHYDETCDVFAYGIFLSELVTGRMPYSDLNDGVCFPLGGISNGTVRPTLPAADARLAKPAVDLLCSIAECCWRQAPSERLSLLGVLARLDAYMMNVSQQAASSNGALSSPSASAPRISFDEANMRRFWKRSKKRLSSLSSSSSSSVAAAHSLPELRAAGNIASQSDESLADSLPDATLSSISSSLRETSDED